MVQKFFENIKFLETVDSTNNFAKKNLRYFTKNSLIFANEQTNGRGRFSRSWESSKDSSIIATFVIKNSTIEKAIQSTFLFSLAVRKFLLSYLNEDFKDQLQLKWPNDILIGKRKICGILSEFVAESILVGIGVNVFNFNITDSGLEPKIAVLENFSNRLAKGSLTELQLEFLAQVEKTFLYFDLSNPEKILNEWFRLSGLNNKKVKITQSADDFNNQIIKGVVKGLSPLGELVVLENGTKNEILINHGDVVLDD